jgi:hypothetical protein
MYYPQEYEEGYFNIMDNEEREMWARNIRLNRQLQHQLRQRGQELSPRKVIPIRGLSNIDATTQE